MDILSTDICLFILHMVCDYLQVVRPTEIIHFECTTYQTCFLTDTLLNYPWSLKAYRMGRGKKVRLCRKLATFLLGTNEDLARKTPLLYVG